MKRALLLFLLVLAGCDEPPTPVPAPSWPVSDAYAHRFVVSHECANGVLPVEDNCTDPRPMRAGSVSYRRLDWSGVQATDNVLGEDGGIRLTFDFGDGARSFGTLDRGRGDGGDMVRVTGYGVGADQTEDGGAGRQWWRDPLCHSGAGWLLFANEGDGSVDGQLGLGRSPEECPTGFSRVHTRWRVIPFTFLWTVNREANVRTTTRTAILTEHFSNGPPDRADHMERMVFVEYIGRVTWERWEHLERTHRDMVEVRQHHALSSTDGRCPLAAAPPGEGWIRTDCRVWTHYVREPGLSSVSWP